MTRSIIMSDVSIRLCKRQVVLFCMRVEVYNNYTRFLSILTFAISSTSTNKLPYCLSLSLIKWPSEVNSYTTCGLFGARLHSFIYGFSILHENQRKLENSSDCIYPRLWSKWGNFNNYVLCYSAQSNILNISGNCEAKTNKLGK